MAWEKLIEPYFIEVDGFCHKVIEKDGDKVRTEFWGTDPPPATPEYMYSGSHVENVVILITYIIIAIGAVALFVLAASGVIH